MGLKKEGVFIMSFSEKEKGFNNSYKRRGVLQRGFTVHEKKNVSHINAFKSNNFEFVGKTEKR